MFPIFFYIRLLSNCCSCCDILNLKKNKVQCSGRIKLNKKIKLTQVTHVCVVVAIVYSKTQIEGYLRKSSGHIPVQLPGDIYASSTDKHHPGGILPFFFVCANINSGSEC